MTKATPGLVPGLPERYHLQTKLAETAQSDVYLAVDDVLHRDVVIKVLRSFAGPAQRAAFVESNRLMAGFRDPRIVVVFDAADPADGQAWTAMEYHPGGSLADELRLSGPMQVDRVLQIAKVLASVLGVLHRDRRTLHRDIKPGNVLIGPTGSVVLADFGIATHLHEHTGSVTTTALSAYYAAPEVSESGRYDVQSEIYSLGVTIVELLCGTNPYAREDGETDRAYARRRATAGLPSGLRERDLPQPLLDLLTTMLAGEPSGRPASWNDVIDVLHDLAPGDDHALPSDGGLTDDRDATASTAHHPVDDGAQTTTVVRRRPYTSPEVDAPTTPRRSPVLAGLVTAAVVVTLVAGWTITRADRPIPTTPAASLATVTSTASVSSVQATPTAVATTVSAPGVTPAPVPRRPHRTIVRRPTSASEPAADAAPPNAEADQNAEAGQNAEADDDTTSDERQVLQTAVRAVTIGPFPGPSDPTSDIQVQQIPVFTLAPNN